MENHPFPPWPGPLADGGRGEDEEGLDVRTGAELGTHFDLKADGRFWEGRHVVIGCIVEVPMIRKAGDGTEDAGHAGLLVKSWKIEEDGMWLEVKPLGGDHEWCWQEAVRVFSRRRLKLHLCKLQDGGCPSMDRPGYHVEDFHLFQPGVMGLGYVDKKRMREWEAALAELGQTPAAVEASDPPEDPGVPGVPARLSALRQRLQESRARGVAEPLNPPSSILGGHQRVSFALGNQGPGPFRQALALPPTAQVISDEEERVKVKKEEKRRSSNSMGQVLKEAVNRRARLVESKSLSKKKRKKRGRSRSRSKRRRRRSPTTSSSQSGSSTSSSGRLLPPLQKKATRRPGSVLAMMIEHVTEALAQAAVEEGGGSMGSTTKFMTYYQILVRPQVGSKVRDQRELETLARGLDMLREGRLEELGDLLSGRFVAVENAGQVLNSWKWPPQGFQESLKHLCYSKFSATAKQSKEPQEEAHGATEEAKLGELATRGRQRRLPAEAKAKEEKEKGRSRRERSRPGTRSRRRTLRKVERQRRTSKGGCWGQGRAQRRFEVCAGLETGDSRSL